MEELGQGKGKRRAKGQSEVDKRQKDYNTGQPLDD